MPVEITMPLTTLEQAVADARENERIMSFKVEDAKLALKSAKTAWEEAVGALMLAVDDMIRDKRQPSLPFCDDGKTDEGGASGGPEPTSPAGGGGEPTAEPASEATVTVVPSPSVQADPFDASSPQVLALAPPDSTHVVSQQWRDVFVAEHLESPPHVFDALGRNHVATFGELADALQRGEGFGLLLSEVADLEDAVEDISADSGEPVKFDKADDTTLLGEERGEAEEKEGKEHENLFPPEPPPVETAPVEAPAKPAKKGRKKKALTDADLADL